MSCHVMSWVLSLRWKGEGPLLLRAKGCFQAFSSSHAERTASLAAFHAAPRELFAEVAIVFTTFFLCCLATIARLLLKG